MADRVGQHIDNYRLIRLLGTGSFGEVYLGKHLHDQTLAAVKLLNLNQENLKEFVKEASTTFRLKHAHIIHLLAFGMSADDISYLVMDYAPNGTLRQRHPKGTRLPLDTIVSYISPLASALQYAHDNRVIHCDVKPENVLIGQNGEVLLSDFGIAVIAPIEQSLRTQNMGGTAPYMAPEQIRGKPQPASDQYALGIMAYEWLCGVRPFQGTLVELLDQHRYLQPPPLREKLPDVPPMVEEIILKALAKDPQQRFARVLDFATVLQQVTQAGKPSPTLSSLGSSIALSSMDVSSQPNPTSNKSAISRPRQVPSKLPSREPLIITNPTLSIPTAVPPTVSVPPSFSSSPISYPHTPRPVPVPSILFAIRRSPTRKKLILFIGLLLVIVGSSVFLNNLISSFNQSSSNQSSGNLFSEQLTIANNIHLPTGEVLNYRDDNTSSQTLANQPHYLEGLTYNLFDGHNWSSSVSNSHSYGINQPLPINLHGNPVIGPTAVTITQIPQETKFYIFGPEQPFSFSVPTQIYTDGTIGAWTQQTPLTSGEKYTVSFSSPPTNPSALSQMPLPASNQSPWNADPYYTQQKANDLQVPGDLSPNVTQMTRQWMQGANNAYEAMKMLETHLDDTNVFTYSLQNDPIPPNKDVVDWLLETHRGYCTYYASTMAIMGRLLGIPTRIVSGFSQGHFDQQRNMWVVDGSDAHSWVQAYLPNVGWISFDPTPTFAPNAAPSPSAQPTPPPAPTHSAMPQSALTQNLKVSPMVTVHPTVSRNALGWMTTGNHN